MSDFNIDEFKKRLKEDTITSTKMDELLQKNITALKQKAGDLHLDSADLVTQDTDTDVDLEKIQSEFDADLNKVITEYVNAQ